MLAKGVVKRGRRGRLVGGARPPLRGLTLAARPKTDNGKNVGDATGSGSSERGGGQREQRGGGRCGQSPRRPTGTASEVAV